jgi:hypothetical protein
VEKEAKLHICATSVFFTKTTQSEHSPNRRKFAQSGHPVPFRASSLLQNFWPLIEIKQEQAFALWLSKQSLQNCR